MDCQGQLQRIVSDDFPGGQHSRLVNLQSKVVQAGVVALHGDGALKPVACCLGPRYRRVVEDDSVKQPWPGVFEYRLDVLGCAKPGGLPGLRHQVADVDLDGRGPAEFPCDSPDQKIRHDAGKKRSWTHGDDIGTADCLQHSPHRAAVGRHEVDAFDSESTSRNGRLSKYPAAVLKYRLQPHVAER